MEAVGGVASATYGLKNGWALSGPEFYQRQLVGTGGRPDQFGCSRTRTTILGRCYSRTKRSGSSRSRRRTRTARTIFGRNFARRTTIRNEQPRTDGQYDTGEFTGELRIYWEGLVRTKLYRPESSEFDQGFRDGEDAWLAIVDPFVRPVVYSTDDVASNRFNPILGQLSVKADAAEDDIVVDADGSGNVRVFVNGLQDTTLGTVAAGDVQLIVVVGGEGPNRIDLSAVTSSVL